MWTYCSLDRKSYMGRDKAEVSTAFFDSVFSGKSCSQSSSKQNLKRWCCTHSRGRKSYGLLNLAVHIEVFVIEVCGAGCVTLRLFSIIMAIIRGSWWLEKKTNAIHLQKGQGGFRNIHTGQSCLKPQKGYGEISPRSYFLKQETRRWLRAMIC